MKLNKMSERKEMKHMKGMKWIIVLLALFVVAGAFVGAAIADSENDEQNEGGGQTGTNPEIIEIDAVTVNLAKPVGGGSPGSVTLSGEFAAHLNKGTITWSPQLTDNKFAYNQAYSVTIPISVKDTSTHKLASTVNVTGPADATSATYANETITVTFPATGEAPQKTEINAVTVNLAKPVGGGSPGTVTLGGEFATHLSTGTLTWSPQLTDNKFAYNQAYTASIPISVKTADADAYKLASEITVTKPTDATSATYANGTITVTFPATGAAPEKTEINAVTVNLAKPVGGGSPGTVTLGGEFASHLSTGTLTWSPQLTDNKFAYNQAYSVTIPISVKTADADAYKLASEITVTKPTDATSATYSNGVITVAFPATGADTGVINSITLSVTPKPSAGTPSSISIKTGDPNENNVSMGNVTWKNSEEQTVTTLTANTDYTAVFSVTIPSDKRATYKFGNTVNVAKPDYATGNPTVVRDSDYKISVTIPFKTAEAQKVTKITVSGITAPATDATPSTSRATLSTTPESALSEISYTDWKENGTKVTGKFQENKEYTAEITVKLKDGFTADNTLVIEKPSNAASATPTINGKEILIKITYPKTSKEITAIALTMDAPAANSTPSTGTSQVKVESGANYSVKSLSWVEKSSSSTPSRFESGKQYTATIVLETTTGYTFDTSITSSKITVNGETIDGKPTLAENNTKLTIKYTFPEITVAPTISLSANPSSPVIKLDQNSVTVTINHTISGDYYSASVNYGDGSNPYSFYKSSASSSSTHTYSGEGTYTVAVNVYDESSKTLASKTITITVSKEKVNASFTASPSSGEAPLEVLFTGTTAGNVTGWSWDFGDGTQGVGKSQMHTYTKPGRYTATLTVTVSGTTTNTTQTITVTEKTSGNKDKKTDSGDDGEPLLVIGDTPVPSFFDIIHEFVHLLQSLFDFENHPLFPEMDE